MARISPIYEARAKVSEILRRVTTAASVTTFFLASVTTFLLASCGSNSSQPTYDAAIQEGQTAAQELINQGASAVAIALVDTLASGGVYSTADNMARIAMMFLSGGRVGT